MRSSEVDNMLCFRSIMLVRSFTVNKIRGMRHQPLLHAIRNLFVFVAYCHLLELYVKCAVLYRIFIAHSFWNTRYGRPTREKIPSDPVVGRVRGMVVGQGSYKQKTLSVTRNMVV